MSASVALQKAIYSKLPSTNYDVYDAFPTDENGKVIAEMPYYTIGEEVLLDESTKTTTDYDLIPTIHCWSDYSGTIEVKQMMDDVYKTLKVYDYNMTGYKVNLITLELWSVIKERQDDGKTINHGVIQIRFNITEE